MRIIGYRTNEDGTPQAGHESDVFANNWQVEQAYAHVLTHPGVPTVFWKHYFDWGSDLQNKIRALINARKVAGVHAGFAQGASGIDDAGDAQAKGEFAAFGRMATSERGVGGIAEAHDERLVRQGIPRWNRSRSRDGPYASPFTLEPREARHCGPNRVTATRTYDDTS